MTAYRDAAIREADRIITRTGYLPIERIATAVVDAVTPIIRADRDAATTECGICYALIVEESFSAHVEWHSDRGHYS